MNPFSAFNFGRLIKTFLPGYVHFLSLLLAGYTVANSLGYQDEFKRLTNHSEVLLSVGVLAGSLILGILSNMVVWGFVTDRFVRRHFPHNGVLHEIREQVVQHYLSRVSINGGIKPAHLQALRTFVDPKYLLMHRIDTAKLVYLEESYWYYMEFQLNMAVAGIVAYAAFACYWSHRAFERGLSWKWAAIVVLATLAVGGLWTICVRTARRNYERHANGLVSLLLGHLPSEPRQPE